MILIKIIRFWIRLFLKSNVKLLICRISKVLEGFEIVGK